jgi:hypothetical protein
MFFHEMDDPPDVTQLKCWAQTRTSGRYWYVVRGIMVMAPVSIVLWLAAKAVAFLLFGREFDLWAGIELLPLGPAIGWLKSRELWVKNEQIFAAAKVNEQLE